MHSKVIIASLVCMLAASFGNNKNLFVPKATQQNDGEISYCDAPNEHHASVHVLADRGDISAGGWFDILTDVEAKVPTWSTVTEEDDPYSLIEGHFKRDGQFGVTINIPSQNGDYHVGFGIDGSEIAKAFIFVKDGFATVSLLSNSDARAKYFMDYVATAEEKMFLSQHEAVFSPRLNNSIATNKGKNAFTDLGINGHFPTFPPSLPNYEPTKFDAEKKYGDFVYGTSDIFTTKQYIGKSTNIYGEPSTGVDVNIHVTWYDENNNPHPVVGIQADILSPANVSIDSNTTLLNGHRTDENGFYHGHISPANETKYQIDQLQFRLSAIGEAAVVNDNYGIYYPYCYSIKGNAPSMFTRFLSSYSEINYEVSIYCGASDRANAFEITQAEMLPYIYARDFSDTVDPLQVHYPAEKTYYSNNSGEGRAIRVRYDDFTNWDVLNHEYGHHVCDALNLCSVPSLYRGHDVYEELTERYGLENGLELAFSEGLATYIGMASQMYKTEDLNIPGVGDMIYQDSLRGITVDYSLSSAGLTGVTSGEGIECCITSVLLKILTNPATQMDDAYMWEALNTYSGNNWYVTGLLNGIIDVCGGGYTTICQIIRDEHFAREYVFPYDVAEWNIMLYMCGSNMEYNPGAPGSNTGNGGGGYQVPLGTYTPEQTLSLISADIERILNVPNKPDNVNILIETGGSKLWTNTIINNYTNGERNKLNRFHVAKKSNGKGQLVYDGYDYGNMGNPEPFADFLEWGLQNYPARKTGVILVGHGGAVQGVCPHEYTYFQCNYGEEERLYNYLEPNEMAEALDYVFEKYNVPDKFEFVGYDACVMQVQDVAYFNAPYFKYMAASEEIQIAHTGMNGGTNWLYNQWLDDLYTNPSIATNNLLHVIANNYAANGYHGGGYLRTTSVLDLSKMNEYYNKFEKLADDIRDVVVQNGNAFNNLINQCYWFADGDMGTVDGYDLLTRLYNWSPLTNYRSQIYQVRNAYLSLVEYNRATDESGNERTDLAHGLTIYVARDENGYSLPYYNHSTGFYNWKSIVAPYQ